MDSLSGRLSKMQRISAFFQQFLYFDATFELTIPSDENHAHDQQSHEERHDIHWTELVDVKGLELRVTHLDCLADLVHLSSVTKEFSNCAYNCVNSSDSAEDIGNRVT